MEQTKVFQLVDEKGFGWADLTVGAKDIWLVVKLDDD
jgi:hypothetical protein